MLQVKGELQVKGSDPVDMHFIPNFHVCSKIHSQRKGYQYYMNGYHGPGWSPYYTVLGRKYLYLMQSQNTHSKERKQCHMTKDFLLEMRYKRKSYYRILSLPYKYANLKALRQMLIQASTVYMRPSLPYTGL